MPSFESIQGESILIHAVSLGEAKCSLVLIKKLKMLYPDMKIVCTVWTETGHAFLKKETVVDCLLYFPLDISWSIQKLIRKTNPQLVVFVENDIWPNFLRHLKKSKVKTILVNGKLSAQSFSYYSRFPLFSPFNQLDRLCVQNQNYADLFIKLGVDQKKVLRVGNLKFDVSKETVPQCILKGVRERKIVSIVSTHPKEEELLLPLLLKHFSSSVCFFLAPRHPERFPVVENLLKKMKAKYTLYSPEIRVENIDIILVNTLGVLESCYPQTDVTIVGGSFCKDYPGHNIYEPLLFGSQVIFGPGMKKQQELKELLSNTPISKQVTVSSLIVTLKKALSKSFDQVFFQQLLSQEAGALNKTERIIKDLVENQSF